MKGYVYRIDGGGHFYIGSTSLTPEERLREHIAFSRRPSSQRYPVYTHFTEVGWEHATITALREVEWETKQDLLKAEREELDKVWSEPGRLNKNRPHITRTELKERMKQNAHKWHQQNKEQCKKNLRHWRRENPGKVALQNERRKEKYVPKILTEEEKERAKERLQKWREANPEKYAEQKKRSYEQIKRKRQARKKSVEENTN